MAQDPVARSRDNLEDIVSDLSQQIKRLDRRISTISGTWRFEEDETGTLFAVNYPQNRRVQLTP